MNTEGEQDFDEDDNEIPVGVAAINLNPVEKEWSPII
jgi:hypothetical protein